MKILILACLVALALARETVESLSNSEESITHIKKKLEQSEREKQQQRKNGRRDEIHSSVQPQPVLYPYAEPIPYTVLPQNVLPFAQPAMVLPFFQPEIMEVSKAKETAFPKRKVMPFSERQIPNLTDPKNPHLSQPQVQPLMHQVSQPLFQIPMLPTQPLLSIPQPKVMPFTQQVMTYPQRNMPIQALLQYQEPLLNSDSELDPVAQPFVPVYNLQQVSPNSLTLLFYS
ncbi:beta-casein [Pteropus medius]|uniref:beta-casein n=1 Tax=Pteropus vampyrus TaxID=132908 RepID=UPI00196B3C15|nr:beta-casein [Pteropus giganteus]